MISEGGSTTLEGDTLISEGGTTFFSRHCAFRGCAACCVIIWVLEMICMQILSKKVPSAAFGGGGRRFLIG